MTRPLTEDQARRLITAAYFGVTRQVERSAPSLERRGLMERYRKVDGGMSRVYWRCTPAGFILAAQLFRERRQERSSE